MIRRRRPRAAHPIGTLIQCPPLVVLLLLTSVSLFAGSTFAQTTWLMSQTPISPTTARTHLRDLSINHRWVPSDPIPPGIAVRDDLVLPEVKKIEHLDNGGITVDRFRGRVWTTSGDKDNLVFVSMPVDSSDPQDKEIVSDIAGTYPFSSNIDGITIMYGFNGRPKYMWCVAFTEYSYIKMRGDTWTWAPLSEKKSIPGEPAYPVTDIAFTIVETREDGNSEWVPQPSLVAIERWGYVFGFNPFAPEGGKQFTTGTGLYGNTGIAIDTSQPDTVTWDAHNDRRMTGRILVYGELYGQRYVKDIDNHIKWPVGGLGSEVLGLAYSAEMTRFTSVLLETSEVTCKITQRGQLPKQPIMRLAAGERQPIRLDAQSEGDLSGYRAFFVANLNYVPTDPMNIALDPTLGIKGADYVVRGRRDPETGQFYAILDPGKVPVSPIPFDEMYYLYGQWVFVGPQGNTSNGEGEAMPTKVSDPVRIAFSNAQ